MTRNQRIDLVRLAAQRHHGVAHRGQIDHAGHAGKVLQHHARRHEGDFGIGFLLRLPGRHGFNGIGGHAHAVFVAQQVFQQDLHRVGQALDVESLAQLFEAVNAVGGVADGEVGQRGEGVAHGVVPLAGVDGGVVLQVAGELDDRVHSMPC